MHPRRAALPLAAGLCCLAPPALCQPGPPWNASAGGADSSGDVPAGSSGDAADTQGDGVAPANVSVVQGPAYGGANVSAQPQLLAAGPGNGATGTVYVLRHGEKVDTGDHLNATGLARAQWVAHLWSRSGDPDHVPPKAIFANFFDQEYNSVELAEPLGRKLNVPVNSAYHRPPGGDEDNTIPGQAMLYALRATGGPVLTVWESYNMVGLVRSLGCDRPWLYYYEDSYWGHNQGNLHHKTEEYDRYFMLRLRDGVCVDVRREYEGFDAAPTWHHPDVPTVPPEVLPCLLQGAHHFPLLDVGQVLWYLPLIALALAATVPRRLCKWSKLCGKPPADAEDRMRKPLLEP